MRSASPLDSQRFRIAFALAVVAVYLGFAYATARTQRPRSDEGYFASPALNLVTNGSMGTPIIEGRHEFMKDINRYTYWIPPLHLLAQAAWYKLWGFSLLAMRAMSMVWALVGMAAWYYLARWASGDRKLALYTMALVALDYHFIMGGSSGRMDMMSAALGFAALAAYVTHRERRFTLAVVAANTLVAASGFTHPVGGYLYFSGLVFLMLYLDRRRLRASHVALAAMPYLVCGAGWGLYILQDPEAFRSQFGTQATMDGRLSGLTAPWLGLLREITARYFISFGLGGHSPGNTGPIYLKAFVLVAYFAGIAGALATREIRQNRGYRAFLFLLGIFFLLLGVLDAQKAYYYLVHVLPFYAALFVAWMHWLWARRRLPAAAVLLIVGAVLALQLGGIAWRARLDNYARSYQPAVEFVKQSVRPAGLIIGAANLGFGLGFPANLVDDVRLGYYTGRRPECIVVNEEYRQSFRMYEDVEPEIYRFVERRLTQEYREVYSRAGYTVFTPREVETRLPPRSGAVTPIAAASEIR